MGTSNPGTVPLYRYLTIGDLDFDVPFDIVATASQTRIDVYKGTPTGPQFKQTINVAGATPRLGRVAIGDFNSDGRPDICAGMSFFADAEQAGNYQNGINDRGNGSPLGVVIFLNTSN